MKLLDFLSNSPKNFIFEKDSNKTTFGGVLTIIYLIALLIIAFIFIYNYETNNKYIITYGHYQRSVSSYEEVKHLSNDPKYNPTLEFIFNLTDLQRIPLSDNFIILDYQNGKIIERNKPIEYKVSDLYIAVLYKCQDQNCSPQPEDIKQFPLNLIILLCEVLILTMIFLIKMNQ